MPRLAARVDGNQAQITKELRQLGMSVQPIHMVGKGVPDLLVGHHGHNYLVELKDPDQPPSKRVLTKDEDKWHRQWKGQVWVCESTQQILDYLGE